MKRRDFLRLSGALTTQMVLTSALAETFFIQNAFGAEIAVDSLRRLLRPEDGVVLVAKDAAFAKYQTAFNKRVMLTPAARVMCQTPEAVKASLQWAQDTKVPLAMRAGGHSYEGFSQSTGLVIDVRLMNEIDLSADANSLSVGAGALLGDIYQAVSEKGRALPAGSCPTVGVTGHTTGGGYGLLARPLGLACDSLTDLDVVTADGRLIRASETENADLFWAYRGGGGGSFGIITRLGFKTHQIQNVQVFALAWQVKAPVAARLMKTWQQIAPSWASEITSLFKVSKADDGFIKVRCVGQTIGSESQLRKEFAALVKIANPDSVTIKALPFMGAVRHFAGDMSAVPSVYMKAKSDYVKSVMSDEGLSTLMQNLPVRSIAAIFDSYGGAIRDHRDADTAFAHRENTISSVQYYTEWRSPSATEGRLKTMRDFHQSLRPYVSGSAYVNYPDLDLRNWAEAYWGSNLDRLIQVKKSYDPKNLFRHAQSIPLERK